MKFSVLILGLGLLFGGTTALAQTSDPKCEKPNSKEIDLKCIEAQLKGDGLGGWVHAGVQDQWMFVFTWRRPGNFFVNIQLPMSSKNPDVLKTIQTLKRHDRIVLKGSFFENEAPLQHINVTDVKMVEAYQGPNETFEYDPNLPTVIANNTKMIGKVHAVANDGAVLVVEVGDRVYPVFNKKPSLVASLFRNDKIQIQYTVKSSPRRPDHLYLDTLASEPVKVLEEIAQGHDEEITLKGPLVMFPESPQIIFNVYALRTEDSDGIKRNYTLVNFSNIELFTKIRETLEAQWNQMSAEAKYDRNKYINPKIIVEATGKKNLVSPNQANPQIIIEDIKDLKITVL